MGDAWPPVEDGIRAHLQRVYVTPLRLDAAFDTDEECLGLLTAEFPDLVEEDLLDAVAQLCNWKESMVRPFKRNRVEMARQVLFRLPFPSSTLVHEVHTADTDQHDLYPGNAFETEAEVVQGRSSRCTCKEI